MNQNDQVREGDASAKGSLRINKELIDNVCVYINDEKLKVTHECKSSRRSYYIKVDFGSYSFQDSQIIVLFKNCELRIIPENSQDLDRFKSYFANNCVQSDIWKEFQLIQVVKENDLGQVFYVNKISSNEIFAVKSFYKSQLEQYPEQRLNVINEILILKRVQTMKGVCHLKYLFEDKNQVFIALSLIDGFMLNEYYHSSKDLIKEQDIQTISRGIFNILTALQYMGIMHRDIKPENIMIETEEGIEEKHIKLIDFGLSVGYEYKDQDGLFSQFCGTTGYIAPEVIKGQRYDERADVFAVGLTIAELMTKQPIFWNQNHKLSLESNENCIIDLDSNEKFQSYSIQYPMKRPQFQDVLLHPFINDIDVRNILTKDYDLDFSKKSTQAESTKFFSNFAVSYSIKHMEKIKEEEFEECEVGSDEDCHLNSLQIVKFEHNPSKMACDRLSGYNSSYF